MQFIGGTLYLSFYSCHSFIRNYSQIFKDATNFFSRSTPNLTTVIPAMDHIDAHLATASQDLKYSPAIRASVALGKTHLNKYYDMTDNSEVYRIAMSEYSTPNHFICLQLH
jgi:hypothetical protein